MTARESQIAVTSVRIISARDIMPMRLVFPSSDFRYFMVQPKKNGGKRMLTAYNPICAGTSVAGGFSRRLFPHFGQKKAVVSIGEAQNGQSICVGAAGSIYLYYHNDT